MIAGERQRLVETGAECLAPEVQAVLVQLLEADTCARDAQAAPWDFAIEINDLMALGLTKSHLRWLIRKGCVRHAREVTQPSDLVREFQPIQNLAFTKDTCFILADAGRLLARTANSRSAALRLFNDGDAAAASPVSVPHWDHDRRALCVGKQIVKRYRVPSPNQEAVLEAFEEERWPHHIDDPLPPHAEQDSKSRLNNTIKCLNRHQEPHIICFSGDGMGEGVCWELVSDATLAFPVDAGQKKLRLAA